jgi:hypothetical protein
MEVKAHIVPCFTLVSGCLIGNLSAVCAPEHVYTLRSEVSRNNPCLILLYSSLGT